MKARYLKYLLNIYPPYLGAGISVKYIAPDFSEAKVEMRLRWYNRNYVRTHFGGSLYAMVDPFYMLLMLNTLGRDYVVWDKAASIQFVTPGKGVVSANFSLSTAQIDRVKQKTAEGEKYTPRYTVKIVDSNDKLVAKVDKILYIKKKMRKVN